jgi:hypothetical protein
MMYQYIAISSQLPALSELDTLGKAANPGVNSVTLSLELLALVPQISQRHRKGLDKLALLQLRLGVLVRREGEVDCDVYHS